MKNIIKIYEPTEQHPGGQLWVNEILPHMTYKELKAHTMFMHRVKVAAINKSNNRKWKAGDILQGDINNADDYGFYLLID
jgi:hypothetical protein